MGYLMLKGKAVPHDVLIGSINKDMDFETGEIKDSKLQTNHDKTTDNTSVDQDEILGIS